MDFMLNPTWIDMCNCENVRSSTHMALSIWLNVKFRNVYIALAEMVLPPNASPQDMEAYICLIPIIHTRYPETRDLKRIALDILSVHKDYPDVPCSKLCDLFRDHRADVQAIQFVHWTWLSEEEKMAMFRQRIQNLK